MEPGENQRERGTESGGASGPATRAARRGKAHTTSGDLPEQIRLDRVTRLAKGLESGPPPRDLVARLCGQFGPPDADGAWRWSDRLELRCDRLDAVPSVSIAGHGDGVLFDIELHSPRDLDLVMRWVRRRVGM